MCQKLDLFYSECEHYCDKIKTFNEKRNKNKKKKTKNIVCTESRKRNHLLQ